MQPAGLDDERCFPMTNSHRLKIVHIWLTSEQVSEGRKIPVTPMSKACGPNLPRQQACYLCHQEKSQQKMVYLYLINWDGLRHLYISLRFCSLTRLTIERMKKRSQQKNAWLKIPFKGLTYRFYLFWFPKQTVGDSVEGIQFHLPWMHLLLVFFVAKG